jgi:hypothetical protein
VQGISGFGGLSAVSMSAYIVRPALDPPPLPCPTARMRARSHDAQVFLAIIFIGIASFVLLLPGIASGALITPLRARRHGGCDRRVLLGFSVLDAPAERFEYCRELRSHASLFSLFLFPEAHALTTVSTGMRFPPAVPVVRGDGFTPEVE